MMTKEDCQAYANRINLGAMAKGKIGDNGKETNVDDIFGDGFTNLFTKLFKELKQRVENGFYLYDTQFRKEVAEMVYNDRYHHLNYAYKENYLIVLTAAMNVLIAGEFFCGNDGTWELIKCVPVSTDKRSGAQTVAIDTFECHIDNRAAVCFTYAQVAEMMDGKTVGSNEYYIDAYRRRKGWR